MTFVEQVRYLLDDDRVMIVFLALCVVMSRLTTPRYFR